MPKLRRPHVVPAGYQRNFADGERILVVNKSTSVARLVGVRDNFVASHFLRVIVNGESNDAAEDEFARIETAFLPAIRSLMPFHRRSAEQLLAVKAAMAMLWARSFAREVVARRVHLEVLEEQRVAVASDARSRRLFEKEHGRGPRSGELELVADQAAALLQRERLFDVQVMMRHYNDALAKFGPLHLSLYRPIRGCEFVTSDNPVLLARTNELIHVGAHKGLALGDAGFIFLPLTRQVGACLTAEKEGDLELDRITMVKLNNATWRNAVSRIAMHRSLTDWRRACNLPAPVEDH